MSGLDPLHFQGPWWTHPQAQFILYVCGRGHVTPWQTMGALVGGRCGAMVGYHTQPSRGGPGAFSTQRGRRCDKPMHPAPVEVQAAWRMGATDPQAVQALLRRQVWPPEAP